MARVRIIEKNFRNTLNRALREPSFLATAQRNVRAQFDAARRDAIKEFENHEVTKELAVEKTDASVLSKGNIAAALGIYEGDAFLLLENLRAFLEAPSTFFLDTANYKFRNRGAKGVVYEFGVEIASVQDFYDATPAESGMVEWTSKSWAEVIEKGIPFFAGMVYSPEKFLNSERSRSQQAIQRQGVGGKSQGVPYIKDIRAAFLKRLKL